MISFFLILGAGEIGQVCTQINVVTVVAVGFPVYAAAGEVAGQTVVYEVFLFACKQAEGCGTFLGFCVFENKFECSLKPVLGRIFHWKWKAVASSIFCILCTMVIAEKNIFLDFEFGIVFVLQQKKICNGCVAAEKSGAFKVAAEVFKILKVHSYKVLTKLCKIKL